MVPKLIFQPNLVPNLTFDAEVHSFAQVTPVPKLLVPNIDGPNNSDFIKDVQKSLLNTQFPMTMSP